MWVFCRLVYLLLLPVVAANAWTHGFTPYETQQRKCEKITVPMCRTNTSKYDQTRMPNYLGFTSQDRVKNFTEKIDLQKLIKTKCSKDLVFFLCSALVPICISGSGKQYPPCRNLCQTVYNDCIQSVKRLNFTWPPSLNCSKLPLHQKGMCIKPVAFVTPKITARCNFDRHTSKRRSRRKPKLKLNLKRYDYVFCVKYETKRGGNKFQVVSMISQYDCGTSQLPTVPQLFLNRSSCKRKIRRADGHVWVLVKKGSNTSELTIERSIYSKKESEMIKALKKHNCVLKGRSNNDG